MSVGLISTSMKNLARTSLMPFFHSPKIVKAKKAVIVVN